MLLILYDTNERHTNPCGPEARGRDLNPLVIQNLQKYSKQI